MEDESSKAKTKLSELLQGQAPAELVRVQDSNLSDAAAAVEEMRSFMRSGKPVPAIDLNHSSRRGGHEVI